MKKGNIKSLMIILLIILISCSKPTKKVSPIEIPQGNVKGIVNSAKFELEEAILRNETLILRQGADFFADQQVKIALFQNLENLYKNYKVILHPENISGGSPFVIVSACPKKAYLKDP